MNPIALALKVVPRPVIRAVSAARWRYPWLRGPLDWVANRVRNSDGVIQSGLGAGLRFNPGPSNAGYVLGTSEPGLQAFFARHLKPGMTVVDGGANVGFLSILAAKVVGPTGRVIAFEPLPSNADRIEHNARLNGFDQVVVRREALGAADATAHFQVAADPTMGRLGAADEAKPETGVVGDLEVRVRGLDSVVAESGPVRPDLIKLDIEGAEADALRGAEATIRAARPILLIELHDTNAAVASALEALDYHAAVMGDPRPVAEANWNAYVVAAPRERADLARAVDAFCAATEHDR